MPLYSSDLYSSPSSSAYAGLYLPSAYSNHSSLLSGASSYRAPIVPKTIPRFPRSYKPHLGTISEAAVISPIRKFNPGLLLQHHSSPKYKAPPKPIKINTADIDVSYNKYRKYDRKTPMATSSNTSAISTPAPTEIKRSPDKLKSPSPPTMGLATSAPKTQEVNNDTNNEDSGEFKPIRRDRALVRLHTVHKKDSPRKQLQNGTEPKSWRANFYEDMKQQEKQKFKKSPGEMLVDKFLIRTEEEEKRLKQEGRKIPRRVSVRKPSFQEICRVISSETINEDLNPGQPEEVVRRQSKQLSEDLFKQIRRNSAEILKENVEILEDMLRQENLLEDENNNTTEILTEIEKPKKKKVVKKKSNEKLVLDQEGGGNKSGLQRRGTVKKYRRTSTDSSILSDCSQHDEDMEKAFQEAIRDISQVEVEEIRHKPKPKITATVDVVESPSWKAVIDNVEIIESPTTKKPKKFKYNVTVEEIEDAKVPPEVQSNKHLPQMKLDLSGSALAMKRERSKSPQPPLEKKQEQVLTPGEEKKLDLRKLSQPGAVFNLRMHGNQMGKISEDESPPQSMKVAPKGLKLDTKVESPKKDSPLSKFEVGKSPSTPKVYDMKKSPGLASKDENKSGENFWEKIGTRESVSFDHRKKHLEEKRLAMLIKEEDEEQDANNNNTGGPIWARKFEPKPKAIDNYVTKVKTEEKTPVTPITPKVEQKVTPVTPKIEEKPKTPTSAKVESPKAVSKIPEVKPKVESPKIAPNVESVVKDEEVKVKVEEVKPTVEEPKKVEVKPKIEEPRKVEVKPKLEEPKKVEPKAKIEEKPKPLKIEPKTDDKLKLSEVNTKIEEKQKAIKVLQAKVNGFPKAEEQKAPIAVDIKPKIEEKPKQVEDKTKIEPKPKGLIKSISVLDETVDKPKIVEKSKSVEESLKKDEPKTPKVVENSKPVAALKKLEEKIEPVPKVVEKKIENVNSVSAVTNEKVEIQVKPKLVKEKSVQNKVEVPVVSKPVVGNVQLKDVKQNGELGKIDIPKPKTPEPKPKIEEKPKVDVKPKVEEKVKPNLTKQKSDEKPAPKLIQEKPEEKLTPKITKQKSEEKPAPKITKQTTEEKPVPKLTKEKSEEEKQKPKLTKEKSQETTTTSKAKLAKQKSKEESPKPGSTEKPTVNKFEPATPETPTVKPPSVKPAKKIISKRSLVNKSGIADPDLEVFKAPTPPASVRTPSPPKFVPLQSNRISQFMNQYLRRNEFDDKGAKILYARPKTIRHRHYPRPRVTVKAESSDEEEDDDEDEEESSEEESATPTNPSTNSTTPTPTKKEESSSEEESSEEDDEDDDEDEDDSDEEDDDVDYEAMNDVWGYGSVGARCGERDSPTSNPERNPALVLDPSEIAEEFSHSSTFAGFQRSGRITPPATTIPKFCKYNVEDFNFLKVLGKGSFGKVLLAELKNSEYYYAIKCLKKDVVLEDDDVECTLIERKVLALGTKHPYLCHLLCTFQTDSHLFFVMEYLNGGDLMFHIQECGRFQEPRARFYAAEIMSGLKFLHGKGIVYRDLKLDNILLDFDGHVRIADFGMCKLQIFLDRMADTFCGTPDYMAPEIIKGQHYNQNVDWWSFGVLLYEMLIGQSPFSGCDEDELFWSICNERPVLPRFLSQESISILTLLLEKDATKRLGNKYCEQGDIQDQPFFRPIDWEMLSMRQLEPPFKPDLQHPLDTKYFDRTFTAERAKLTPIDANILASMNQAQFQGFSYTNPNATDR
ncbi:titin isoform X2 [Atheta coriaria]|uniref:titin isoform X2 n=1 Tax=Dalotia coriaria TaxID=877792 RepID=UPI0031F44FFB